MAGDDHLLRVDPEIEKWAHMRENTHKYFGWSRKTVRLTMAWAVAVPVALTYLAYKTDDRWNFTAGQTKAEINKQKPQAEEEA
ncbi:hypothetical protein BZG36_04661 [Bifiguratus adelaidae]|uniref:NADH-ubiquinone oxidoreductase B15 subunit n=1 Tax=Bifiguratus adelaidae TaxID=1938954 RepID=A0A261Y0C1_9FUNG|nr:hypothetical protein BZG36_04661 [Bifiguratus adelaidae]